MLRIRLTRTGKKRQPSYRVVVANSESKRDGRIVERIGNYNPLVNPTEYKIQEDRALYWLSVGAQPSDAVRRLLEKQGTYDRLTRYRGGENMEALVAEYEGVPYEAETVVVEEVVEEEKSSFLDGVLAAAAGFGAAVEAIVDDVVEEIQDVLDDDEEE